MPLVFQAVQEGCATKVNWIMHF